MLSPGNFKVPLALTVKKKRIGSFEGLPEFKWSDLGEQDVVGQDSFGAVFVTKYAKDLARNSGESVVVNKFIDAFTKEARLLHDLDPDNIVKFKAVCHEPVAVILEYVYSDLSVFGGEGKVSSLKDFISCLDTGDCNGMDANFMNRIESDIAHFKDSPF